MFPLICVLYHLSLVKTSLNFNLDYVSNRFINTKTVKTLYLHCCSLFDILINVYSSLFIVLGSGLGIILLVSLQKAIMSLGNADLNQNQLSVCTKLFICFNCSRNILH